MPRWMWIAIGASALAHVGAGAWLYYQRLETPAPDARPDDTPFVIEMPRPPLPEPVVKPELPQAPASVIHETPLPTQPTDVIAVASSDATDQPAGPIAIATPSDAEPTPGPVATDPAPPADPVIRNPQWVRRPSPQQLMNAYPDRALDMRIGGQAVLSCAVMADGSMSRCSVVSETPGSQGFGRAAMGLSRHFRISPRTVDGRTVEGARVTIPIRFGVPD